MRQVLGRSLFLLTRPAVFLSAAAFVAGSCSLILVPLFDLPGYELALALAVGEGILGGIIGASAAFQERRLIQGRDPRPKSAQRQDSAIAATFLAGAAAIALNLALLLPAFGLSVARAALSTRCDPFSQLGFFPLLPVPSAAIAAGTGAFCAFATRRKLVATLLYASALVASLTLTLWPVLFGPQLFAYNHFLGYLPGPLYDEALSLGAPLYWFRLQTVALCGLLWVLTASMLDMREGRLTRPHLRPGALALTATLAACIVALERRAPQLGFRMTYEQLQATLGGTLETEHFTVVYPRGTEKLELERLERELEFRHAQLSAFLGSAPKAKIRVFEYRSTAQKAQLVGAALTQFAKPWLNELHVDGTRSLKHELAHVMAAPFGSGPFRVTSRYGLWPSIGIVEGFAVAADDPVDELTLHQWAAGMRRLKLLPDVRDIVRPQGFYAAAPARAYTATGSFLRYLAQTHGAEKLKALYARGDFETSFGRSLEGLASEWEKYLDAVPLDGAQAAQAFARFRQGSIFSRPCAREVASLRVEAYEVATSDPARALLLYGRCAQLQPDEPEFQIQTANAMAKLDRAGEATELLEALAQRLGGSPALKAEVLLAQADIAQGAGKNDLAAASLRAVLQLGPGSAVDRTAQVKLAALQSPTAGPAIFAFFRPGRDEVKLLRLRDALDREPDNAAAAYLLGRRLEKDAPALAARYLARALQQKLPDSLRREALRLKLEALYLAGDFAGVRTEAGLLGDLGPGLKATAEEWVARCAMEERAFHGPLTTEDGFSPTH